MNMIDVVKTLIASGSDLKKPKFLSWNGTPEEIVQADSIGINGSLRVHLPQVTGPDNAVHTIEASRLLTSHAQDSVVVDGDQRLDGRVGVRVVSTLLRLDLVVDVTWTGDDGKANTVEIRCRHNCFNLAGEPAVKAVA